MAAADEMDFPHTPDAVTKEWLSGVFGATVSALSLTRIGEELGASAIVFRATLSWRGQRDLPDSLILKFASAEEEYRAYANKMGTYLKEVRFYQTFGAHPSLPVPRTFFSELEETSGHFLIVMEDLAGARMSRWFGDAVADVELALKSLAKIHGTFWNDAALEDLEWLGRADAISQSSQYRGLLQQLLPPAKQAFGNLLSEYSWAVLEAWLENWELVRAATSQGDKTLVHREADMRQMFFPTQAFDRFVLFDWQSPEIGWGAADACRMITTSLNLAARRRHEIDLVALYADELQKHGVANISTDTLWRQVKVSQLMNVLAHMFSLLWVESEETAVWQRSHLGVLGAALVDWKLLELINGMRKS